MSVFPRPGRAAATVAVALFAASHLLAAERFRAIQPRVGGAPGRDMIRISVSIREYTTADEARALQQAAARGGRAAIVDRLRTMNHGSVSITGVGQSVIYAARTDANSSGRRILVICGRPASTDSSAPVESGDALRVIELQVDRSGHGDGRLIDAASVRLDDQGFVEVEQPLSVPRMLVEVRPDK